MERSKGLFLVFEGIHGAGKRTQAEILRSHLRDEGYSVVLTREVGGTPLAERIRSIITVQRGSIAMRNRNRKTMLFLVMAARASHLNELIRPSLREAKIVISERYEASTYVYQHYCERLSWSMIKRLNKYVTRGLSPHLTIVLDLPVEVALARRVALLSHDRTAMDIWDRRFYEYHKRAREGYLEFAKSASKQCRVVDASRPIDAVAKEVRSLVQPWLNRQDLSRKFQLPIEEILCTED